jgi:hypothetical protein
VRRLGPVAVVVVVVAAGGRRGGGGEAAAALGLPRQREAAARGHHGVAVDHHPEGQHRVALQG